MISFSKFHSHMFYSRGRHSIVRQCIHVSTGDICAVKLISKKYISHERALHEYALVSSIHHDSIVKVFHFIEINSFSIIISEL
jgi:serine/threonine protein kinase